MPSTVYRLLCFILLLAAATGRGAAQRFAVESFKLLPNDVSAFISPVTDNNDDACGLVKVIGSEEFVFSTPLGIVKRTDKVGEIWLYIPARSKKMTLKHAEWGVLRDYQFPVKIESHMTYEMRLKQPSTAGDSAALVPVAVAPPVVKVIRDTLTLTRVDTLVVKVGTPPVPWSAVAVATGTYGGKMRGAMAGIMLMGLKRHGLFLHGATDFGGVGTTIGTCSRYGERPDGTTPFFSGRTRRHTLMATTGLAHRLSRRVTLFEGAGYGSTALAWELSATEGGGYLRNSWYTTRGIAYEAGVALTFGRVALAASASTIRCKEWFGSIGVGIRFGK